MREKKGLQKMFMSGRMLFCHFFIIRGAGNLFQNGQPFFWDMGEFSSHNVHPCAINYNECGTDAVFLKYFMSEGKASVFLVVLTDFYSDFDTLVQSDFLKIAQ